MRINSLALAAMVAGIGCLGSVFSEAFAPSTKSLPLPATAASKQINLTVLLDLSNRIRVTKGAAFNQVERDKAIVQNTAEWFQKWIQKKGGFGARGCYTVEFEPYPMNLPHLATVAESMHFDLGKPDTTPHSCQQAYSTVVPNTKKGVEQLYHYVVQQPFDGADIWGFAKDKLAQHYVRNPTVYRNVLVLVTDGYIDYIKAHKVPPVGNKTAYINDAYITQSLVQKAGFTAANWQAKYEKGKYGLQVPAGVNLKGMEVLVLGIYAYNRPAFYDDVIKRYVTDWFKAMGAARVELYGTDRENLTQQEIQAFLD